MYLFSLTRVFNQIRFLIPRLRVPHLARRAAACRFRAAVARLAHDTTCAG